MPILVICCLVYIGAGCSVFGFVIITGPKQYHTSPVFRQRYKFALSRWHPTYYWWGAGVVAKNLLMCLVPVISSDGLVQMVLLALYFAPPFLVSVHIFPWRAILANWNDLILSSMFLMIIFLSSFFVDSPSSSTSSGG